LVDGSEIVEIPMKNDEISLILKFNRKTVDDYCPLCDDVITLEHFEELMAEGRRKMKIIFPQFWVRTSMNLNLKLAEIMHSYDNQEETWKRFHGEEVDRPKGPKPLTGYNPESLFKGTAFSSESRFNLNGNIAEEFKINDAVQYMSLKVTAKFNSNHKNVEVPITQDSKDKETDLETLLVNYPFTFYVTDVRNKVVLAAGKIVELEQIHFGGDEGPVGPE
jgi:serine protease inhibitor